MPYRIIKQLDGRYMLRSPNRVHGRGMTLINAKKQRNLLNAVEHSDWRPAGGKNKR